MTDYLFDRSRLYHQLLNPPGRAPLGGGGGGGRRRPADRPRTAVGRRHLAAQPCRRRPAASATGRHHLSHRARPSAAPATGPVPQPVHRPHWSQNVRQHGCTFTHRRVSGRRRRRSAASRTAWSRPSRTASPTSAGSRAGTAAAGRPSRVERGQAEAGRPSRVERVQASAGRPSRAERGQASPPSHRHSP